MGRNQIMIGPFAEHDKEVLIRKAIPFESESGTLWSSVSRYMLLSML